MERWGYDAEMLSEYYENVIKNKYAQGEPMVIFGHPDSRIGKHPEILHRMMRSAAQCKDVWMTDFESWAHWWRQRHDWRYDARWNQGLKLDRFPDSEEAALEVFTPGRDPVKITKRDAASGDFSKIGMSEARSSVLPSATEVREEAVAHSPYKKLKLSLKDWLDWEVKTPVRDYVIASPRDIIKIILRVLYAPYAKLRGHHSNTWIAKY
jgi:hypothetical protein